MSFSSRTITRLILCTICSALLCGGCGLIYKQNIQQGNALEQEDLDELYVGMNKRQVLFVLGSPSIRDPFNQERWDYVQTFSRRGGDPVQRTVTLHFENDLLSEIIGVDDVFQASADSDEGETVASSDSAEQAADPHAISIESAEEEVLDPEITGLGERTAEDREFEKDMDVLDQRPADDVTGPDIDG